MRRKLLAFWFGVCNVCSHSNFALADDLNVKNWPQFRGVEATGVSKNVGLPDRWSATENIEWKKTIPGRGWGSPIVWGDNVFVSTVVNSGIVEPIKKGLYFSGERLDIPKSTHQWKVMCLDLTSGTVQWEKTVRTGIPTAPIHLKNSYASETPVTDGKHVFVTFGNVGIFCFDMDGYLVWSRELPAKPMRNGWGTSSSSALHGNVLYHQNDNDEQSSLIALDKVTGKELWSVARDEKSNWSTPFVWSHAGGTEIVTAGTRAVRSYNDKGAELWSLKGMSSITIATPYVVDGLLYVSSGYVLDPTKAIYAIKPGAKGDLTLAKDQTSNEYIVWSSKKIAPYNPTTLACDGRLFVLYDGGILSCFDARSGSPFYERERISRGAGFTASPWSYDGKIFCLNEDGECFVIRPGEKLEVMHSNKLAEGEICMSTPSIAGDRLLIRADERIYCIRTAK
jgi:outer membrane protein assembly factor BamB